MMSEIYEHKYWTPDGEYVQVRVPDKMRIAALLNEAKGDRTMAQLAEACGVSASTLSRAVNGKITKPLTLELIKAIVDNAENAGEAFFEQLMRANGMMPKESAERLDRSPIRSMEKRREYEIIAKNIISSELMKREIPFRFIASPFRGDEGRSRYGLRWTSSFAFEIIDGDESYLWNMLVFPYEVDLEDMKRPPAYLMQRLLDNVSGWFLTDAWEPDKLKGIKNSIVFMDSIFYDIYIDNIFGATMNNDFSLLLVGKEEEKVKCELMMPKKIDAQKDSVFARPVVEDDGDGDDPWGRPDFM